MTGEKDNSVLRAITSNSQFISEKTAHTWLQNLLDQYKKCDTVSSSDLAWELLNLFTDTLYNPWEQIADVWSWEDVEYIVDDRYDTIISENACKRILKRVLDKLDAGVGISYETVLINAVELYPDLPYNLETHRRAE